MDTKTKTRSGLAWLFPVGASLLLPAAFLSGYAIGVSRNDIQEIWPYVSDTGASPPESCVFGQLVNMSAGLMMVTLYLRHRHVMAFYRATKSKRKGIILSSRIFLGIGIFAAFGVMLVANFQEHQVDVSVVHFVGAGVAFSLGIAYAWYQTVLSFLTPRQFTPRWLALVRLAICIFGSLSFVFVFARNMVGQTGLAPSPDPTSTVSNRPLIYYRGPGDPGYTAFLVTTISEWCLSMAVALYFLTLAFDLKRVSRVYPPRVSLYVADKLDSPATLEPELQLRASAVEPEQQQQQQQLQLNQWPQSLDSVVTTPTDVPDPTEYRLDVKRRVNKIPLPGLTSDQTAEMQMYLDYSGGNSNAPVATSPVAEQIATRPRGLRRSYDTAVQSSTILVDSSPHDSFQNSADPSHLQRY